MSQYLTEHTFLVEDWNSVLNLHTKQLTKAYKPLWDLMSPPVLLSTECMWYTYKHLSYTPTHEINKLHVKK